jgi:hypothetical protein
MMTITGSDSSVEAFANPSASVVRNCEDEIKEAKKLAKALNTAICNALDDSPRSGRPAVVKERCAAVILRKTTSELPFDGALTHWSSRILAKEVGCSYATVQSVWRSYNLKPHLLRTFKVSNDPLFVPKVLDVTELYINPPKDSLVLCVDEKTQIQAL